MGFPISTMLEFPRYVMLEPINRCNASCVMCGIDFTARTKAVMTKELWQKIATELAQYKDHVEKVLIALDGEPLLDKNLHERVRTLKEAGVQMVNVTSNASLLDQKRATELIEAGMDEIYITIDSLKKPVYESIRVGLDFDAVYANTKNFIKLRNRLNPGLTIRVAMIMQEANYTEADAFSQHWQELLQPHDQIAIQKAHNWSRSVAVMEFGDEAEINNIPCIAIWGTMTIHADGVVGLCCMDTKCAHPIGDVNLSSMAAIWRSDFMVQARQWHLGGQRTKIPICDGCTVWRPQKRHLQRPDI